MPVELLTGWTDRLAYAHDASLYRLVPSAVVRPRNEDEIRELLSYARTHSTSVTFRTGGTSLSGQAVTSGLIAEVVRDWKGYSIKDQGKYISVEPGLTGEFVNRVLQPYGRRIGPDPASIKAARIGGIASNNASGMCCGVVYNSYHTMHTIRFILANGQIYDTAVEEDYDRFVKVEKSLADGLLTLKARIENHPKLADRVRDKYRRKNTLGYSLNAFIDYDHPLDIFAHLLIGAEGTLAFISRITFETIPDPGQKATGLLLFPDVTAACRLVPDLISLGADAVELMDHASLKTAQYLEDPPYDPQKLEPGAAALLVEFQRETEGELSTAADQVLQALTAHSGHCPGGFRTDEETRLKLWKIRKALYPTVGSMRKKGTSVLTEDICFDIHRLPAVVNELQTLFRKWHYDDAVIFGHAKDGNLHFVASIDLETESGVINYQQFMDDLVALTAGKYQGALKAEHGTGRNMAPFIAVEWGGELADLMWELKALADPDQILNPGVLLTRDTSAHIKDLKPMPVLATDADLCIECGFCEHLCPSRELTLTPRQRIALAREWTLADQPEIRRELEQTWKYVFDETCATDGLCELACPVNINTGHLVKAFRRDSHSRTGQALATWTTRHFALTQGVVRSVVRAVHGVAGFMGHGVFTALTMRLNRWFQRAVPVWSPQIPDTPIREDAPEQGLPPDYIYFPSCISRTFAANGERESLQNVLMDIGRRCGISVTIPKDIDQYCCGTPYHSKGFTDAYSHMYSGTIEWLYALTNEGKIPIVVDTSPCSFQFTQGHRSLPESLRTKWQALKFVDLVPFLETILKGQLQPTLKRTVVLHTTCSTRKMQQDAALLAVAKQCAGEVIVPDNSECCAFAGDRGLLIPELTHSAVGLEKDFTRQDAATRGYSSSRMCEVGMSRESGLDYYSIALLVRDYLLQK
ncbi:MAG: FAD-binding and (Fe-S)-binding domain-containing protein [Fidelibacterota bacterium]